MIFPTRSQLFSKLSIEQQILLAVCSMAGSEWRGEANVLLDKSFSWDQLILLSDRHRMLPLLYKNLKDDFRGVIIPPIFKEKYEKFYKGVDIIIGEGGEKQPIRSKIQ